MTKRNTNWNVPADWQWHIANLILLLSIFLLTSIFMPVVSRLLTADVSTLYGSGIGAGIVGVFMLFSAKRPLYRQYRLWTFGPRQLDRKHRRLYWAGYICITISFVLLGCVCLRST